jgi:hypothetical protein
MSYSDARIIPFNNDEDRVETGATRFGDDWNGLFIRGDDCIMLMAILEKLRGDSVCRFLLDPWDDGHLKMLLDMIHDDVLLEPGTKGV